MPVHERRQHFRIEDHIYFEYKILKQGICCSEKDITGLLDHNEHRYLETTQYFQTLNAELADMTQTLATKDPTIAHYLNLINAKVDYLARQLLLGEKINLRKVNISLGGMSFKTKEKIEEKTPMKIIIYTKPKMIPIVVNAIAVYNHCLDVSIYRTAVQFENLTLEQEQLLSQHILCAVTT